jgi:Ca-activated chloride channel family protein
MATDGDFNAGASDPDRVLALVQDGTSSGVFLTVLGVGSGNLDDELLERIADRGDGDYAYVDSKAEAERALARRVMSTLVPIAKDVKVQVEFNPATVEAWRLLGYEDRLLRDRDFRDDAVDAGEIGAGHNVTALYEIVPSGMALPGEDARAYGVATPTVSGDTMTVKLRYKRPGIDADESFSFPVSDPGGSKASADQRLASAAAEYGMLLRDSEDKGASSWAQALDLARSAVGRDPDGARAEFVELVRTAGALARPSESREK